ncbi:MAG: hypothetical protein KDB26_14270, partial [Microthrixaceae bacterium]|nr:hypothetical protein [Microthrixaceae bacterium]
MGSAAEIVLKLASAVASGQIEPVLALEQFKELEVPHGPEAQQFHAAAAKLHLHAGRHHFFMDSPQDAQALRRCGIEYAVQAVAQSDTDSAAEANAQMDLALLRYDTWFDDDSDLSILRLALDAGERSIAIRGIDSRLTSRWKANLATMYSDAGDRFGEITLFDRGVDLLQDALVNRPTPDPDLPVVQFNLSEILMTRFKRRGAEVDLDEAVKWSELASQSSIGTSWEDHIVGAHGSALAERYRVIGSLSDLERSIEIGYEQLGTGADAGRSYGNLSGRLAKRFDVSGDPADLVEAERLARKAYELSPPARAATPGRFAGWARSVADLATRLPLFNEVSAVLDEFGSMEGDGRDDSDRPPSWSSILYYVSQTIDSALVDRTQQGPISRDRKIELARRAISTATPNEGAWSDQVTWLAVAYLFDRRVANEGAVESDETPLLLEQFADALTRSAPAVHLFERAAALLRATRWSTRDLSGSRRLLAQVIAQQFSSWVMAGLSADRVDLTTQRLSDLGE